MGNTSSPEYQLHSQIKKINDRIQNTQNFLCCCIFIIIMAIAPMVFPLLLRFEKLQKDFRKEQIKNQLLYKKLNQTIRFQNEYNENFFFFSDDSSQGSKNKKIKQDIQSQTNEKYQTQLEGKYEQLFLMNIQLLRQIAVLKDYPQSKLEKILQKS